MALLEAINLCFAYPGGQEVLHNVNITVRAGECIALLGANGCGKTTLFQQFNGLLKPKSGVVRLGGKDLDHWDKNEVLRRVGLVFQDPNDQLFAASVFEDVSYGPVNLKLPQAEIAQRVQQALECVGMWEYRKRSLHQLSFGQKKRVAIAGILAMQPEIIILDEPTAGLDPRTATALMRMLKRLQADTGLTVVLSTHEVDLVPVYCDRAYVMQEGRIVKEGSPTEVFAEPQEIRAAFLRMPRVAHLWEVLRAREGLNSDDTPLTIHEARTAFRKVSEVSANDSASGGNSCSA